MRVPRLFCLVALAAVATSALACDSYADALARGQRAFEANEQDRALAIFRGLEPDVSRLTVDDRARYAYLRGMTDYRIGYKAEARHWLAIAAATTRQMPDALPETWARRMNAALTDLNESIYKGGISSLTNTPAATPSPVDDEDAGTP